MAPPGPVANVVELDISRQFELKYVERHRLVILTRSANEWTSAAELDRTFTRMEKAIRNVDKPRSVLLIDSRSAPPRNDREFERVFEQHRRKFAGGFRKVAVLVMSAVGRLQVQRHAKQDNLPLVIFSDWKNALVYLEVPPDEIPM